MSGYTATVAKIAARCARLVGLLYGGLPAAAFMSAAALVIAESNQQAASWADLALSYMLRNVVPLALGRPLDDLDRLERNLDVIVSGDPEQVEMRLERMASSEPPDAARAAFGEGLIEHGAAGWTRRAQPGACELCKALADGSVLPIGAPFYDHPHCSCTQIPVVEADRVAEGVPTTPVPVGTPLRSLQTGHGIGTTTYAQVEPGLVFVTTMRRVEA